MIIDLDKETRIRSDKDCWKLEREAIVKGKQKWRALGYYTTFGNAVTAAYKRDIRMTDASGLVECVEAAERILQRYRAILDEIPHELVAQP